MRIRWLRRALLDLIQLRRYIADNNPAAAADTANRIIHSVESLIDHPALGRYGRGEGTRELVVSGLPYIIPYRIKNKGIEILRVMHTSMKWPDEL